jgi:hypothetical protein
MHPIDQKNTFGDGQGCWVFLFPMGSQIVPQFLNVFPNMFPKTPYFIPLSICFAQHCQLKLQYMDKYGESRVFMFGVNTSRLGISKISIF